MSAARERAGNLQSAVKMAEAEDRAQGLADSDAYSGGGVRQAIVHTRQDTVLVVSYLESLNREAATIRRLLWFIAAVVGIFAWRSMG